MPPQPQQILKRLHERRKWLIWPAVLATVGAVAYSLLAPKLWTATQTLHVREEGVAAMTGLGRFESVDAMQTAQETIHEVAHHTSVLRSALLDVGPRKALSKKKRAAWPSQRQIDDFRGDVYLQAPDGTAFGRSEVIRLTVRARSAERAKKLAQAVYHRLDEAMKEMRREKYESIIAELENGVRIAQSDLRDATERLTQLETEIGENLPELRVMMNAGQGDGNVRRTLSQIEAELRAQQSEYVSKSTRREQLLKLKSTPAQLISMPNEILDSQPSLRRLRESLVDARVNTARLMGVMSAEHPQVRAAVAAENKIRHQLVDELQLAAEATGTELAITEKRIAALEQQLDRVQSQIGELSGVRADYAALVSEVEQRTLVAQNAQTGLTKARASMMAAAGSSLLNRVGTPVPRRGPCRPSRQPAVFDRPGWWTRCGIRADLDLRSDIPGRKPEPRPPVVRPICPIRPSQRGSNTGYHRRAAWPSKCRPPGSRSACAVLASERVAR